jgi:hypothetical protein
MSEWLIRGHCTVRSSLQRVLIGIAARTGRITSPGDWRRTA